MPELYTIQNVEYRDGVALLTLAIPEVLFRPFQQFLHSTISISSYVQTRARVARALEQARSASEQEKRKQESQKLFAYVVSIYDSFFSSGSPTRQAIRQTRDKLNSNGHYFTCYTVELILRKAGRLRKANRRD